jgi:hypothetical protein
VHERTNQQAIALNLHRRKVRTYQNDEIRCVFTPIEQSYNSYLKNILLWTSSREKERAWANKVGLVGMFEIEWKTPRHNILVEFLNNQMLDIKHNIINVMLRDEQRIIDKHVLEKVFKICHTREIEIDQTKMFNASVALADITNRILDTYNTNEGWVVKKMRSKYVNRTVAILPIIYQKNKVQYFNNKFSMMISKEHHGEFVNWATIIYS